MAYEEELVAQNAVQISQTFLPSGERVTIYDCFDDDGVFTKNLTITEDSYGASLVFSGMSDPVLTGSPDYLTDKIPNVGEPTIKCPVCKDWFPESYFQNVNGIKLCVPNKCYNEVRPK